MNAKILQSIALILVGLGILFVAFTFILGLKAALGILAIMFVVGGSTALITAGIYPLIK